MPSYYQALNTLVIDSETLSGTRITESALGTPPVAKHSEAHDIFTRDYLLTLNSVMGGDENLIYDEVASRGGYIYVDSIDYDYENFLVTIKVKTYFPTQEIYEEYLAWAQSLNILGKQEGDEKDYKDPKNHRGRGYATIEYSTVDFNKPYRS